MTCVTSSGRPKTSTWLLSIGTPLVLAMCLGLMNVDYGRLGAMGGQVAGFLGKLVTAPDMSYLPTLARLTLETLGIAFVASVGACVVSFPLAFLAAPMTTPHPFIGVVVRAVASVVRSIPDLLLALVLASAIGLGNVPGVVALAIASVAYLVKAYAEVLDVVDRKPIEGVVASGGDWIAQRTIGITPQAGPDLVGLSLYIMDSNLRSASILGAVGAGGIGYDLAAAIRHFRFDRLGIMIFSIYLTVGLVDALSTWIRRKMR